ncbi:MAG: GTPase HflX [Desulfobacterales bacterium]
MKRLHGNTGGLKANQTRRLEKLYRRRVSPDQVISFELARELSSLSSESRRQIGLLIDRGGRIVTVIVGDHRKIVIPDLSEYRAAPGRLRGLRCLHTHLNGEPPSRDDLTDLALLRLDLMGIVTAVAETELPRVHLAHILPGAPAEAPWRLLPPRAANAIDIDCLALIKALEDELGHVRALHRAARGKERALLVSVTGAPGRMARDSLAELKELAASSGIEVVDTVLQHRKQTDARFLMGRGKVEELTLTALNRGAGMIVFDQDLNPSQIRAITDRVEIKVIDRTMLILDIFAQRALSREGKLQVELAQLKYMLPRLIVKNTAMSRLTGGIGGRGPGETKLEINRRRVRDRIAQLEKALILVRRQRKQQRARRSKKGLPIISIVGYTNAGKSTLLNTLTRSSELVENRLFATLDPSSRRLRFPRDIEVIITDTVGFIRDLPQDLVVAFRATLEELENADLLLHVIDISNPRHPEQIRVVENILHDLKLERLAVIRVLNKQDLVDRQRVRALRDRLDGIAVSATAAATLLPLIERMQKHFLPARENRVGAGDNWPEEEMT